MKPRIRTDEHGSVLIPTGSQLAPVSISISDKPASKPSPGFLLRAKAKS